MGVPCLNGPSDLQVHGESLFIVDQLNHAIRIFKLRTHQLRTLAGDPTQLAKRPGPLRYFSPSLPVQACASLGGARSIAITAGGHCRT